MSSCPEPRFVSESIRPAGGDFELNWMAMGEPGLPSGFSWRSESIEISEVLRRWRETSACSHGSGEAYASKHWFEVATRGHGVAKIYFERQPRGKRGGRRWWLFSIEKLSASDV